jgi:hypothetical protein
VWVSDVFAWRESPAAWSEEVVQVDSVFLHAPDAEQLNSLGDDIVIAGLSLTGGSSIDVATLDEHRAASLGPFGKATEAT